jgi:hypothetical protein
MEFLHRAWDDELPTLAGQAELLPLVAAALADFGVTVLLEEVFRAIWLRIEPAEESVALVRTLRRNGYGVHLGANQDRNRATHMREVLGYDAPFDVSCYSWELAARKPDPTFFAEAARRIGADPAAILFIGQVLAIRDSRQPPCTHVTDLLARRLAEVDARLAELTRARDQLVVLAARAAAQDPAGCRGYCSIIAA